MTRLSIFENAHLKPFNTFGLDVSASELAHITSPEDIQTLIQSRHLYTQDFVILGGGSNVLFIQDFDGLVMRNEIKGKEVVEEDEKSIILRIGGGENWHELILFVLTKDWGGIENLSLIPGSVGAAPIQNIGAYGVELAEVFVKLEAINLSTGRVRIFDKSECQFGYRDSIFKRELKGQYFITHVFLSLSKTPTVNTSYGAIQEELARENIVHPTIQDVSRVVSKIRQLKLPDPAEIGNAGSFFKNPIISSTHFEYLQEKYKEVPYYRLDDGSLKIPAAWLIQTCGWKGKNLGTHGVHKNQALVLVNLGGATGKEILALSQKIQQSVWQTFRIKLEREVNVI